MSEDTEERTYCVNEVGCVKLAEGTYMNMKEIEQFIKLDNMNWTTTCSSCSVEPDFDEKE